MQYVNGNLWDFHPANPVCITTNGVIKKNGELVMGAGIALQAKMRFPILPYTLALLVRDFGNIVFHLIDENLFSFPTKNNWRDKSDIDLIAKSAQRLVRETNDLRFQRVYLPKPGCANGQLSWPVVDKVISEILDDRFVVVLQ